jgi:hypothetical protein
VFLLPGRVKKVRKLLAVLLLAVCASAWGQKYVFTLFRTPFYSDTERKQFAFSVDANEFADFAEIDRYRYVANTLWYRAATADGLFYYFDSSKVALDVQFIDPSKAIAKTLNVLIEHTGEDAKQQPDFVDTFSTILLLDVKARQVVDRFMTPDARDELAFDLSDPTYVKIRHSYHHASMATVDCTGVYFFVRSNLVLHKPAFHYFERIGAQNEAQMDGKAISITNRGAQLDYNYYERVGDLAAGHGTLSMLYTVDKSGCYILGEISMDISIDPSWYENKWPFRRSFGGQDIFGTGWYPVGPKYFISVGDLMRKFCYFGIGVEVAFGMEYVGRGTESSITDTNVNLREVPSLDGKVVAKLREGDRVRIVDRSCTKMNVRGVAEYWYKVLVGGDPTGWDQEGWIFGQFLDTSRITSR